MRVYEQRPLVGKSLKIDSENRKLMASVNLKNLQAEFESLNFFATFIRTAIHFK